MRYSQRMIVMRAEHLVYSFAIAMLFGLAYYRLTGRDHPWIIVFSAFAPDLDVIADAVMKKLGVVVLVQGHPIVHGDFHNLIALSAYSLAMAFMLSPLGIKFVDGLVFASVGFTAHLFEDALAENPAYDFFYPLSDERYGIGIFDYYHDFYGIADREVLITGLILAAISLAVRLAFKRRWHAGSLWP